MSAARMMSCLCWAFVKRKHQERHNFIMLAVYPSAAIRHAYRMESRTGKRKMRDQLRREVAWLRSRWN